MRYNNWPKIDTKTSIEEVRRIHKMIWDFVVEIGRKPYTPYRSQCALCEYVIVNSHGQPRDCDLCPAIWSENSKSTCMDPDCLYHKWLELHMSASISSNEEIALAKAVRDIPFWIDKEDYHGVQ